MELVVAADAAEITVAVIGVAAVAIPPEQAAEAVETRPEQAVDAETAAEAAETPPVQVVAAVAARLAQAVAVAAMAAVRMTADAKSAARTGKATMRAGV